MPTPRPSAILRAFARAHLEREALALWPGDPEAQRAYVRGMMGHSGWRYRLAREQAEGLHGSEVQAVRREQQATERRKSGRE